MALIKPFYHHAPAGTGSLSPSAAAARYPYHDNDQCPVGQTLKESDQWQYYPDEPDTPRERCFICDLLAAQKPAAARTGVA